MTMKRMLLAAVLTIAIGGPALLFWGSVVVQTEEQWTGRDCYQKMVDAEVPIPGVCYAWIDHCRWNGWDRVDCDFAAYWPPRAAAWIARSREHQACLATADTEWERYLCSPSVRIDGEL